MSQAGIHVDDDGMLVVYPPKYPSEEVKSELGGRWDKKLSAWKLHPVSLNVLTLADWYGNDFLDGAPQDIWNMLQLEWGFPGFEAHPELKVLAENHKFWELLYPFQQKAVEYTVCNPHRGCVLGLSPGLGKTVVTVVVMDILKVYKCLITAPLTLAKNWGTEIERWGQYFRSWSRSTAAMKDPMTETVVTNFETVFFLIVRDEDGNTFNEEDDPWVRNPRAVKAWIEEGPTQRNPKTGKKEFVRKRIVQPRPSYGNADWEIMVVDESILLKNRRAVKVDVLTQLAKFSHMVLLLSGSPTAKYRDDLYPQIRAIKPKAFGSYWRFAEFFCTIDRGEWGWDITGDRPDHDPQKYLKDLYLVMNQKDVLPDLPDYIYEPIEIDLNGNQQKAFKQMVDEWIVQLEEEDEEPDLIANYRLAQETRLLQITSNLCNLSKGAGKTMPSSSAKEDLLVDLIKQGDIEFPLLVWTWWVPTTLSLDERLYKLFGKELRIAYVTGGLTAEQKDAGLEGYKNGEYDILILQMGVGKFGHNLVNTRTVFYHDRHVDSDAYLQSLRRVRRIGLDHRPRLIVPRARFSGDPIIELNLAGKLQSVAKVASHDLQELLRSLGDLKWSMDEYDTGIEDELSGDE